MQELCEAHGAKLILLVPPTLSAESAIGEMAYAAHKAGVDVSVPIDPAALSATFTSATECISIAKAQLFSHQRWLRIFPTRLRRTIHLPLTPSGKLHL